MPTYHSRPFVPLLVATVCTSCVNIKDEFQKLSEQIADSRAPDSRAGVLAEELDPASRARLELLGRTSAPTRYAERTDANRIRVVAFDFGGAKIGQRADTAGNLLPRSCLPADVDARNLIEVTPLQGDADVPPAKDKPEELELYKGMFRQYGRQVGTTIDAKLAVGPVGTTSRVFFSHNFLVLEWRRYQLERFKSPHGCDFGHVSAIERGIAVRIVFDVRLRTTDAKLSAAFGIADLAVALARSEATIEASYEIVGTSLDLLPDNAIIITSVNEYMEALKKFHEAVAAISGAWRDYNLTRGAAKAPTIRVKDKDHPRTSLFAPDQLAYYVDGLGLGDEYLHLEKADACNDIEVIKDHYAEQQSFLNKQIDAADSFIRQLKTELDKEADAEDRRDLKLAVRDWQTQREEWSLERRTLQRQSAAATTSFVEKSCERTLKRENARIAHICAEATLDKKATPYFCDRRLQQDIADAAVNITEQRKQADTSSPGTEVPAGEPQEKGRQTR